MGRGDFTADAPGDLVDAVVDGYETAAFVPHDLDSLQVDVSEFTTAYSLIDDLVDDDVLEVVESDGDSRLYRATDVYEVIENPLTEQ